MCSFRFSISLRTATASLTSYDEFRKHMTSNIEQLTSKAPVSKSVHPEVDVSREQPMDPTKSGLKIKTVHQLNEECRSTLSLQIDKGSDSSSMRMKTEVRMRMPSEEKSSRNETNLATKDTDLEPIKGQDLEATQNEQFIEILSENKGKHSPTNDRQTSMSPPESTSPGPSLTSTNSSDSDTHSILGLCRGYHPRTSTNMFNNMFNMNNSPSATDSETESRLEQPYDPFRPLSPCGSVSPYDPARPTESPYDPASPSKSPCDPASPTESASSDSSVELLEPKCLAKRLKRLARKGSFDALAPPIIFCPDIPPLEKTFGEIDTYASFLETSPMSPPQDDSRENCETLKTEDGLNLEVGVTCESKETIKKEADSLSYKSKSKRRSKAKASGENKRLDQILNEATEALKPALDGGQISKSVYAKILTKACGTIKTEGGVNLEVNVTCETKNEVEETESLSCKSKSKRRSKANGDSGENERLDKILDEATEALKPALEGGQISKSVYAKILTKSIPKIYYNKRKEINQPKIRRLMQEYVKKYQQQVFKTK